MPADQTLYTSINSLLLEKLNLHAPDVNTDLIESGLLDSLGFVELTVHLEETFGIRIPMERLHIDNVRSIAAIAEFVSSLQVPQKPAGPAKGAPHLMP
ncbi:acyl carrier protein [Nitrospira sp. Nam74]